MILIENSSLVDIIEEGPKNLTVVRTNMPEGRKSRRTGAFRLRLVAHNPEEVIAKFRERRAVFYGIKDADE